MFDDELELEEDEHDDQAAVGMDPHEARAFKDERRRPPTSWRRRTVLQIAGIVVLALGVAAVVKLWPAFTGREYRVFARLPDVTDITPGSSVLMAGQPVGVVDDVYLDQDGARIAIEMLPRVVLYKDATIAKRADCELGDDCLLLWRGTSGKTTIPSGGSIKHVVPLAVMD